METVDEEIRQAFALRGVNEWGKVLNFNVRIFKVGVWMENGIQDHTLLLRPV